MEKINEIKIPKGVNRIAVKQHDDRVVIEFIPEKRKFKEGDKVTLKSGCISKAGLEYSPFFDRYIGERLEVDSYTEIGNVKCNNGFRFAEDWLEFYTEELKKGDLAIFWDNVSRHYASVRIFGCLTVRGYCDINGVRWDNAIKFDGKEQFEKVLRGEI